MDTVRVAAIQPLTSFGSHARERNLEAARVAVSEAAAQGAHIVTFPESFPGAWKSPVTWTPVGELAEMARENDVYLIGGFTEPLDDEGIRCFNSFVLHGPDGREVGRYRRTTPSHAPWIYKGGTHWDFDWVAADDLPVFETDIGRIGMLMCSEVYAPELSRVLALRGADITFMPTGLTGPDVELFETWRNLVWSRAIENIMFTVVASNIQDPTEPVGLQRATDISSSGLAMVCSPEKILFESYEPGVHVVELDLTRLRELREAQDRLRSPGEVELPWRTKPGNLRDWRRREVLQKCEELFQSRS